MEDGLIDSLKGHFLMAMPGLLDPNFYQTVTCISEHTSSGALGLVINRVHESLSGKQIFDELNIPSGPHAESIPVHLGGPVHVGEVFVLHGAPFDWAGSLRVTDSLAMSNTRDILEAIGSGGGPELFVIALGCAGWGEGQLESEIQQNAWITCPINEEVIFKTPVVMRWETALNGMGIDPSLLSDTAGHA